MKFSQSCNFPRKILLRLKFTKPNLATLSRVVFSVYLKGLFVFNLTIFLLTNLWLPYFAINHLLLFKCQNFNLLIKLLLRPGTNPGSSVF